MQCRFCQSSRVVRNGSSRGRQKLLCRECGHQSLEGDSYPQMRKDAEIIATALDLYFEGLSVRKVGRQLRKLFNEDVATSAIWDWIQKYSKLVKAYTDTLKAESLGGNWHADETMIMSKGEGNPWLWEVIDRDTRYMVASHLSRSRTDADAIALFGQARERSLEKPKAIHVDGLHAYGKGFSKTFWTARREGRPRFIQRVGIAGAISNNPVERLHGTLKDRARAMRGLGSNSENGKRRIGTIENVLKGWAVHYDFVRPHGSLKGRTPAEAAGVDIELNGDGWDGLIKLATVHGARTEIAIVN